MTHKFHSGPPPHVGWWMCGKYMEFPETWRWWNGDWYGDWSYFFVPNDSTPRPDELAPDNFTKNIRWCHYWPKNARVPRINPNTGEVTGGAA